MQDASKPSSDDLSRYLENHRVSGSVDSAGAFTLDFERAWEKLGGRGLQHAEDFVLKLVQCATCLAVTELRVRFPRRTMLLSFETDSKDSRVSVDEVERALSIPLETSVPALFHLTFALCAAAAQRPLELTWGEWNDSGRGEVLCLARGRQRRIGDVPLPSGQAPPARGRRLFLFFYQKPKGGVPFLEMTYEWAALRDRCAFAPMQVVVDGKPLGPSLPIPNRRTPELDTRDSSPYLGALEFQMGADSRLRWPPRDAVHRLAPEKLVWLDASLPPVFHLTLPEGFPSPCHEQVWLKSVYGLPIHLDGSSKLYYVKDGVMLSPVTAHKDGGGAFAVIDGSSVKTDLSGLRAVRDQRVSEDLSRAGRIWRAQARLLLQEEVPPLYRYVPHMSSENPSWGTKALYGLEWMLMGPGGWRDAVWSPNRKRVQAARDQLARAIQRRGRSLEYLSDLEG